MLEVINRRRIVLALPGFAARIMAGVLDMVQFVSGGLIANGILTRDQMRSLSRDNVVSEAAAGFAELGIRPVTMESVLPEYLWRFRPSGQYDEIKRSARQLRG
jgi:NADH dehydrogenase